MTPEANFSVARRPRSGDRLQRGRPSTRSFSREDIIVAVRRWHSCYGESPKLIDWDPARARREGQQWRAERFESGQWPTTRMVRGQFKTFNAALAEAGLKVRSPPSRTAANLTGPDAILAALIEWTRRYGDIPTMADWDPARARRLGQDWRIARYHQGDWPSGRSVAFHYGSFAHAVAAAGLMPRRQGVHHDARQFERHANRLVAARASAMARTAGVDELAQAMRALAVARRDKDPVSMHAALIDLAGAALAWAEVLESD